VYSKVSKILSREDGMGVRGGTRKARRCREIAAAQEKRTIANREYRQFSETTYKNIGELPKYPGLGIVILFIFVLLIIFASFALIG
jgi:hypothetical protein